MSSQPVPEASLREATPSPAVVELLPGFRHGVCTVFDRACGAVDIPWSMAGDGPPLLLLHGHPQSRVIWHKVAAELARTFTVVLTDLRGYGDAGTPADPPSGPAHVAQGKRAMAADQVALMRALGFATFALMGHDRGARVGHRLALDHPQAVRALVLLDIAPTLDMLDTADARLATAYWHWFFLVQPAPLPERLIGANPGFYLSRLMGNRSAGLTPFAPAAWREYLRHAADPATVHAMCEDYRAAAGPDLALDRADREAGRRLQCPVRVLWGEQGVIGRLYNPVQRWQDASDTASQVSGQALPCGHYIPEEAPEALLADVQAWLAALPNKETP